jgi:hypothetical protein
MTNCFSDYEHASWQQRQAESISAGVSCCLTLAQYTSLLDFGLRKFRFTNGLQERIKFVNRGATVLLLLLLKSFAPAGNRKPNLAARSLITTLTELYRLHSKKTTGIMALE